MGPRVAALLSACLLCVAARAQLTIAGSVYEDRPALALRQHFTPLGGVAVKLYRDGGDRVPSADDAAIGTVKTNRAGIYAFDVAAAGDYWVAVDSRTIGSAGTWAEQTFGPGGALCAHPDGTARPSYFEGPCFGGRTTASDDASTLPTSEHVAAVALRESAKAIDFAFSFGAVTSTADGASVQGSLRQFVVNANAIEGPDRMRFVPLQTAPEQRETTIGVPPRWWSILLATPLPELAGGDTFLDGTAYSFLSPASVANVHPGRLGEAPTIRPGDEEVRRQEKPELEIIASGAAGVVCNAPCALRSLAIHGPSVPVHVRADARLEDVMIGAAPDGQAAPRGETGLRVEKGTTVARNVFVTSQSGAGIHVAAGARLDAEQLDVSRCGAAAGSAGIVVSSDGSSIRSSVIAANDGAGILLAGNANTVDGCTISRNRAGVLLAAGSSRNVITRNDLMWNRVGGVAVDPAAGPAPRENRLSANRFDENGGRPIVLGAEEPLPGAGCARSATLANGGIVPPRVDRIQVAGERVVISGHACPGDVVELYQSYVTSRPSGNDSLTSETRTLTLPSVGEFNYLGTTSTAPDGSFEASFPFPALLIADRVRAGVDVDTDIWAAEVMRSAKPRERAFSALAIDPTGNTSEMSPRRSVD